MLKADVAGSGLEPFELTWAGGQVPALVQELKTHLAPFSTTTSQKTDTASTTIICVFTQLISF
jgi:hypothetical protein